MLIFYNGFFNAGGALVKQDLDKRLALGVINVTGNKTRIVTGFVAILLCYLPLLASIQLAQ